MSRPGGEKSPLLGSENFRAAIPYSATSIEKEEEGYSWDFCIVINDTTAGGRGGVPRIIQDLNNVGLQTYSYYSVERNMIIIKIRASVKRLAAHAQHTGFKLMLNELALKDKSEEGIPTKDGRGHVVRPLLINHNEEITPIKPHEFIYSELPGPDKQHLLSLFAHADGLSHPFGSLQRIKLISSIIERDANIDLQKLSYEGFVVAYFPLKDEAVAEDILDSIVDFKMMPWDLPVDRVKEYLGEYYGLYFYFVGHYTTFLVPLAGVGFLVFLLMTLGADFITPIFALTVCVWAQVMIEFWKRRQSHKSMEWGTTGYTPNEPTMPTFIGEEMNSVIDGQPTLYFSEKEKLFRQIVSTGGVIGAMAATVASLMVFFIVRVIFGSFMTYLIQAVVIMVLNDIFMRVSVWLSDRENHRFESEYEESITVKLFLFQFLNSYSMLFYIAFFRMWVGDVCDGGEGCLGELELALFVIFSFRLVVNNAKMYFWPIMEPHFRVFWNQTKQRFLQWYNSEFPDQLPETTPTRGFVEGIQRSLEEEAEAEKRLKKKNELMQMAEKTEKEYLLDSHTRLDIAVEAFSETAIQFGYVTLFVAAFPLAPLFALVSNYSMLRIEAINLLRNMRRPMPLVTEKIGAWGEILQILSIVSVITNSGIICFTSNPNLTDYSGSFVSFLAIQYTLLVLMAAAAYFVPDVPSAVPIQLKRQEVLVNKFMKEIPDPLKRTFIAAVKGNLAVYDQEDISNPESVA